MKYEINIYFTEQEKNYVNCNEVEEERRRRSVAKVDELCDVN
jgi:hypothetical protein